MSAEEANGSRRLPVEILTEDEVKALIRACSTRAPTGVRTRALIAVLYRSGLRISEALALAPRDIDPQRGTLNVRHGKGDQQRIVGMDEDAFAFVQLWLERRHALGLTRRAHVFCTLQGAPVSASYVRHLLPRLKLRAGLAADRRVHAHALRHTHAYELLEEGARLDVIQGQLGHASLAVTHRYLAHIAPAERIARVRSRNGWSGTPQ